MGHFIEVTDAELARARRDPAYRQQLLTNSLEQLLAELNRHNKSRNAGNLALQLREGSLLAVRLADIIGRLEQKRR